MVGGGTSPGAAGAPPGAHLVLAAAAGGREEKARLVEASSRREAPTCVPANALLKIVSIAFLKINILVIMASGMVSGPALSSLWSKRSSGLCPLPLRFSCYQAAQPLSRSHNWLNSIENHRCPFDTFELSSQSHFCTLFYSFAHLTLLISTLLAQ